VVAAPFRLSIARLILWLVGNSHQVDGKEIEGSKQTCLEPKQCEK
jgi:hypothetical protein